MSTPPKSRIVKEKLDPNEILTAEFTYIANSAFQANEDRARVSSYYLVTVAAAIGALVTARLDTEPLLGYAALYWAFGALFAILSAIGIITVFTLAQLRRSWQSAAEAMDDIKEYYRQYAGDEHLDKALTWRKTTIPRAGKINSVAFLLACSVILIDVALAVAAYVYVLLAMEAPPQGTAVTSVSIPFSIWIAAAIVLVLGVVQIGLYFYLVGDRPQFELR